MKHINYKLMDVTSNITPDEYRKFKNFLETACGIMLGEGKQYLIASRMARLLRDEKMVSISKLLTAIESGHSQHLRNLVIDAMTTNETSWFRDRSPFEVLGADIFPLLDKRKMQQCKIWSAGCSSGQEPYTISIALSEHIAAAATNNLSSTSIIATDISATMLQEAEQAEYDARALGRGLSLERKRQFFKNYNSRWIVADEIRQRVSFKEQNLLATFDALGKFDIIFCRNVLIYFAAQRKTDILNRMAQALNSGGFLFLGASEAVIGYSDAFEMIRSTTGVYYRLKD